MKNKRAYKRPSLFAYGLTRFVGGIVFHTILKGKILRNELRGVKGGYVVIANHECALDECYLLHAIRRRETFVVSKAFHETIPAQRILKALHWIPKQQFQTDARDVIRMKAVVSSGEPLVIFPAGLMPENGQSTPIPPATYRFLQWLGVDVYVARICGSYFVKPKWAKKMRKGKTTVDIYKLFDKETLKDLPEEVIKEKVDGALLFDAYAEQEKAMLPYKNGDCVEGLERVLYSCPECRSEGTISVRRRTELRCDKCGFHERADRFGFLHIRSGHKEYRSPAEWDKNIFERLREEVHEIGVENYSVTHDVEVRMIDPKKHKFVPKMTAQLHLDSEKLSLTGEGLDVTLPVSHFSVLPCSVQINAIDVQKGKDIFRCVIRDRRQYAVKILHLLKIFYEYHNGVSVRIAEEREAVSL